MAKPPEHFHPHDTLANTARTTLQTGIGGAFMAGAENALRKQNVGAMGIITRSGGIIALFAGVGATYQFTRDSAANLRQVDDTYNEAIAGFLAGLALGLPKRSIAVMLGAGALTSITMAGFHYTGGFRGYKKDLVHAPGEDDVDVKEKNKAEYRRPISEIISDLGEGRGIYAPGYEERRRQRLLAKYGIDVGEAQGSRA
ncbi:uncharacterized protein EI97DRAFT_465694 [Westerdykella ornata]|uniref:NADH-ubiquinone oxidoreductase 213 kDa subunit n=1 Tax=Westerdykella ornata TaxID=318751 RepID=A0A6A6JQ48_WESOR|nr:uncharacterized protein EI97DRAFT_465694 [Westerdykella ornata]KAF2278385.1 hypothetical protein EI97DRAFT_465694 [Westerdykella ornata]